MDVLGQPTIRAATAMFFVVLVCLRLDLGADGVGLGMGLWLVVLGVFWGGRFRGGSVWKPVVVGGLLGWLSWLPVSLREVPGWVEALGEERHGRQVRVEVGDMRLTAYGCVGGGRLERVGGVETSLGVRVVSAGCLVPGVVWEGHAVVERSGRGVGLDTLDMRWLEERRGGGVMVRLEEGKVVREAPWWRWAHVGLFERRLEVERRLVSGLASPWAGLGAALATGNKAWLDEDLAQEFVDTGTSHVLAISGLHFGIVAAIAWGAMGVWVRRVPWLLLRFGEGPPRAVGMLVMCTAYLVFVGMPASGVRAWVVAVAVGLGHVFYRRTCGMHALAVALMFGLMVDPLQLSDFGFQLSFAATLGILLFVHNMPIWLQKPSYSEESRGQRLWRVLGMFVGVSWAANVGTAPVLLAQTGALPVSSLVSNLGVVPLVSALVFPAFLVGLGVSHVALDVGLWLCGASLDVLVRIEPVMAWFAHQPWNMWVPGVPPWWLVWLLAGVGLVVLGGRGWARGVGVLVGGFLLAGWLAGDREPSVLFLDVGQGDATLVRLDERVVLIDAGGAAHGPDIGRVRVLPQLRRAGVKRVDILMVTHPDIDHSGGVAFLMRHSQVGEVWANRRAERLGLPGPVRQVEGEVTLGRYMRVRAPPEGSSNDESLVVEIRHPGGSMLLTGDMEEPAERWWLGATEHREFDVVKAPHHGSKTSSHEAFVRATRARLVVASAGRNNKFGHPSPPVVARWQAAGARLMVTAREGAVEVYFGEGIRVRTGRGP